MKAAGSLSSLATGSRFFDIERIPDHLIENNHQMQHQHALTQQSQNSSPFNQNTASLAELRHQSQRTQAAQNHCGQQQQQQQRNSPLRCSIRSASRSPAPAVNRDVSPTQAQVRDLRASNALQKSIADLERYTYDYSAAAQQRSTNNNEKQSQQRSIEINESQQQHQQMPKQFTLTNYVPNMTPNNVANMAAQQSDQHHLGNTFAFAQNQREKSTPRRRPDAHCDQSHNFPLQQQLAPAGAPTRQERSTSQSRLVNFYPQASFNDDVHPSHHHGKVQERGPNRTRNDNLQYLTHQADADQKRQSSRSDLQYHGDQKMATVATADGPTSRQGKLGQFSSQLTSGVDRDMRTNAETGAEMHSAWNSGGVAENADLQSSFVRDLKKELGLRSAAASRKADYSHLLASSGHPQQQQARYNPHQQYDQNCQARSIDARESSPQEQQLPHMRNGLLIFKTFEDHKSAIEQSRSRSRSANNATCPMPVLTEQLVCQGAPNLNNPFSGNMQQKTQQRHDRSQSPMPHQQSTTSFNLQNQRAAELQEQMELQQKQLQTMNRQASTNAIDTIDDLRRSYNMPLQQSKTIQSRDDVSPSAAARMVHAQEIHVVQSKLSESLELQGYYQKMAEEYRAKYLTLERDHNFLKHTHEYDLEKQQQEHMSIVKQLQERMAFEKEEADRRLEQAIAERDSQVDHLIDDNKMLQSRLLEEDKSAAHLRGQLKQVQQESHRYLDQIASVKREKELEVTNLMADFRNQKETILEKAQQDKSKREDKIRDFQLKAEKELDDLRSKTTLKKLESEKNYEEVKERLEKEKDKLTLKVAELTEKTTKEGSELKQALEQKTRLHQEFQKVAQTNQEAQGELKHLRQARNELTSEREDLIGDLQGHVAEIENVYQINRELKAKIKRLEGVLYGKNIAKGR